MAYRMKIHLDNEGVYNCLDDSDKERFEEAIISNVERGNDGDEVIISVTLIERKNYDVDKFLKLREKENENDPSKRMKESICFKVSSES